jgi:hypothetical protein
METVIKILDALSDKLNDIGACEHYFEHIKVLGQEDESEALKCNKRLLQLDPRNYESVEDRLRLRELRKLWLLYDARHCFDSYLQALEYDRPPSARFYLPRRKVLKQIVDRLQDFANGELDELFISMPPRTGKTSNSTCRCHGR